jgi:hypothetical protein
MLEVKDRAKYMKKSLVVCLLIFVASCSTTPYVAIDYAPSSKKIDLRAALIISDEFRNEVYEGAAYGSCVQIIKRGLYKFQQRGVIRTKNTVGVASEELFVKGLSRLFDKVDVYKTIGGVKNKDDYDYILIPYAKISTSYDQKNSATWWLGASVEYQMYVIDSKTGATVATFIGKGSSAKYWEDIIGEWGTRETYCSSGGYYNLHLSWAYQSSIGKAMSIAFEELLRRAEPEVIQLAKSKSEQRALPSDLALNIGFSDSSGFLPNQILDAGEEAEFVVSVTNSGKGTGYGTCLEITSDNPKITFERIVNVGDIQPNETKRIKVKVKAELDVSDGKVSVMFNLKEKRGYDAQRKILRISTARLVQPLLSIISYEINDGTVGLASGNGNGIPENGESIELTAFVNNQGEGAALGVSLALENIAPGIEVLQKEALMGTVLSGQTAKGKVAFRIPRTFSEKGIFFDLRASDIRLGPSATKKVALEYKYRMPVLAFAARIFSKGREVTKVANGETVELEITPLNRGDLAAKNVHLRIAASELNFSAPGVDVGDIEPGSSGGAERFKLDIPRSFTQPNIVLHVSMIQSAFEEKRDTFEIPVEVRTPKLGYLAQVSGRPGSNVIMRGERSFLEVQIQNNGNLEAKDLKVKLDIPNTDVKIMGDREKVIPYVPAGNISESMKFDLLVPRKVPPGDLPAILSITQSDFPRSDLTYVLTVKEEMAKVVEVPAEISKKKIFAPPSAPSLGPAIAIGSPQDRLRLYENSVDIIGEVSDPKGIESLKVEINGSQAGVRIDSASSINRKAFYATVPLKEGENSITVVARNTDNVISQETRIVFRETPRSNEELFPPLSPFSDVDKKAFQLPMPVKNPDYKKWAVIIGVEQYRRAPSVPYALRDAQAVKEYFLRLLRIPKGNTIALFDDQATLAELQDLLEDRLPSLVQQGDTVFFYFAGHGVPDVGDGTPYLLPYDGRPDNPRRTAYSSVQLYASLGKLNADKVVVFLDSCFSGASNRSPEDQPLLKGIRPGVLKVKDPILAQKNLVVFTAAQIDQVSNAYQEKQHGLFTYFLLKGLGGDADRDRDGNIHLSELSYYVIDNVDRISRQLFGPSQYQKSALKPPELALGQDILLTVVRSNAKPQ